MELHAHYILFLKNTKPLWNFRGGPSNEALESQERSHRIWITAVPGTMGILRPAQIWSPHILVSSPKQWFPSCGWQCCQITSHCLSSLFPAATSHQKAAKNTHFSNITFPGKQLLYLPQGRYMIVKQEEYEP